MNKTEFWTLRKRTTPEGEIIVSFLGKLNWSQLQEQSRSLHGKVEVLYFNTEAEYIKISAVVKRSINQIFQQEEEEELQEVKKPKLIVDLRGPDGNAFSLIAICHRHYTKVVGSTNFDKIREDMTSSDYDHLLDVFKKTLSPYFDIVLFGVERIENGQLV